jgi:hypothetical protein
MSLIELSLFKSSSVSRPRSSISAEGVACNGNFLLARTGDDDRAADLTEAGIRLWMFWLGLDYILIARRSPMLAGKRGVGTGSPAKFHARRRE